MIINLYINLTGIFNFVTHVIQSRPIMYMYKQISYIIAYIFLVLCTTRHTYILSLRHI